MKKKSNTTELTARLMGWLLALTIITTSLAIIINVNDSTMLKPLLLYVFTGALLAVWLTKIFNGQQIHLQISLIHIAFFLFILTSAFSLFNALNLRLGIEGLARQCCYFVFFFSTAYYFGLRPSNNQVNRLVIILSIMTCAVGLIQSTGMLSSEITWLSGGRDVMSTFGNATYFAGFLVLALPIIASQALSSDNYSEKKVGLLLLIMLMVYLLIKTETRSAWAGALVSAGVFTLINLRTKRALWIAIGIVFATATLSIVLFPDLIFRRISSIVELDPQSSLSRRFVFYFGSWRAFLASPVLGQGIGNFSVFLPKFRSPDYWMSRSEDIVPHAHNEYLEILSETGILGLIFFCSIIYFCFSIIKKSIHRSSGHEKAQYAGYVCGILGTLVDNLGSMNLRTIPVAAGFWMLIACSIANGPVKVFPLTMALPFTVRGLRVIPLLGFTLFLLWIGPFAYNRYNAERTFLEGNLLTWNNRNDAGSLKYRQTLFYDPHHSNARFSLAANLVKEKVYKEAREIIIPLLHEYPFYPKARLLLAISAFESGDTMTAMGELAKELQIEQTPQTLFFAAYFANRMGHTDLEYQQVSLLLENSIKSRIPDYVVQVLPHLVELGKIRQNRNEGVEFMSKLRRTFSTNPEILVTTAECYRELGMQNEIRETLVQMKVLPPSDSTIEERVYSLEEFLKVQTQKR